MKPTCCDTSFLFSFYGKDGHTVCAREAASQSAGPIVVTLFNEYEFLNAMHLAIFRRTLPADDAARMQAAFEMDLASGGLARPACDLTGVLIEAKRLSAVYTPGHGCRAYDVIHVAAALCLEAGAFLSFDTNQRALAVAENLFVNP